MLHGSKDAGLIRGPDASASSFRARAWARSRLSRSVQARGLELTRHGLPRHERWPPRREGMLLAAALCRSRGQTCGLVTLVWPLLVTATVRTLSLSLSLSFFCGVHAACSSKRRSPHASKTDDNAHAIISARSPHALVLSSRRFQQPHHIASGSSFHQNQSPVAPRPPRQPQVPVRPRAPRPAAVAAAARSSRALKILPCAVPWRGRGTRRAGQDPGHPAPWPPWRGRGKSSLRGPSLRQ